MVGCCFSGKFQTEIVVHSGEHIVVLCKLCVRFGDVRMLKKSRLINDQAYPNSFFLNWRLADGIIYDGGYNKLILDIILIY